MLADFVVLFVAALLFVWGMCRTAAKADKEATVGWNDRLGLLDDSEVDAYVDAVYDRAYWLRMQRRDLAGRYAEKLPEPITDRDPGDESRAA